MNIYVGNLSREVTEQDLRQAFEAFGQVESVTVIKDKFSGESKGFGFVEMPTVEEVEGKVLSPFQDEATAPEPVRLGNTYPARVAVVHSDICPAPLSIVIKKSN